MGQGLFDRRLGRESEPSPAAFQRFGRAAASWLERTPANAPRAPEPAPLRRELLIAFVLAASFAAGLGGGGALAEAVACLLTGRAPRLEAIAVRGAAQLAAAEIAAATGVARGVDLRGVDTGAVAQRLAAHPWIAQARAVELPTGRLLVEVVERRAVALVNARGSQRAFAVDASGTPFAPALPERAAELPQLVLAGAIVRGEPSAELAEGVALAGQIAARGLPQPLEIGVSPANDPAGYWLRMEGVAPRIVLGRDGLPARLDALARVLEAGLPEAAQAGTLDLRFADQVVLRGTPPGRGAAQATPPQGAAAASGRASGGRDGSNQGG
jgi:cell division protein FtsQ